MTRLLLTTGALFIIAFCGDTADGQVVFGYNGGNTANLTDAMGNPQTPATGLFLPSLTADLLINPTACGYVVRVYCYSVEPFCADLLAEVGIGPGTANFGPVPLGCNDGKMIAISLQKDGGVETLVFF